MRLSTKGRYGVRAMLDLATHSQEGAVTLKSVAQREQISGKYLEHLFANLKKAGLIHSVRGAQGGYRLGRLPQEVTLGDIIRVLEGPISPTECVIDGDGYEDCPRASGCVMRLVWCRVKEQINAILNDVTLADICEEQRKMRGEGFMYHI